MSSNAVHGVVIQPTDRLAVQVADGVVVLIPDDDFTLRSVDRFLTRILWTTADTAGKVDPVDGNADGRTQAGPYPGSAR